MKLKRALYGPDDPRGPSKGRDVKDFVKRTLHRLHYTDGVGEDFFPKPKPFDDVYNAKTVDAIEQWRKLTQRPVKGPFRQDDLDSLWERADAYARWAYRLYLPPSPVPKLGPIVEGGTAVSNQRLTHPTSGIPGYPAFDDGWYSGRAVIAPEDLTVIEQSGSAGGDAFYARGASRIEFWIGHLVSSPPNGRQFKRGEKMAVLANLPSYQGGPHVHIGINAKPLTGEDLIVSGYTSSGPTVGEQLTKALS